MKIVTFIILGIIIIIFFTKINYYDTGKEIIDYPLRALHHANMEHLLANGISFYGLSFMEEALGSKQYIISIVFIWIVSSLLLYAYHLMVPSRKRYTVGFSGVIFGLIVVYLSMLNQNLGISIAGLAISILPQIFVPNISWEGHIAGVIAGCLYVLIFRSNKLPFLNK